MITAYYRFESLSQTVRNAYKINSPSRIDCVAVWNPKGYSGLNVYRSPKGMLFFYFVESRDLVKTGDLRRASYALSNGKQNLTSLYFDRSGSKQYRYGFPNGKLVLYDGSPNPALPYRHDAYLFICDWKRQVIELLVIQDGKPFIDSLYHDLVNGKYEKQLRRIRMDAGPYFLYNSL
ncbi:hypothetical protein [Spirosoma pollinicola]|uniref:Uncharacterized protein n=1 Tax=Spirosoma pollinicola TaxID=2057025 RepID=A0A2K8Z5K0_9BACT|nr:hypothetical protein [Spirosoma pollinicola]AUD05155.1 hypothetical protein CWM47_26895 [Spirosoma pollinicola]